MSFRRFIRFFYITITCVRVYVEKPEKVYLLYLCLQNKAALFNC